MKRKKSIRREKEGADLGMKEGEDNGGRVVVASGDVAESAWLWL